ncbi:MAG: hypothetical protein COA75_05910 [Cellvibrionales bacterium]|nr:MAG: hypothetical protein COA75_05910 [Cellvibrionales bacterium]
MTNKTIEEIAIDLQPLIAKHRREGEVNAQLNSEVVSAAGKAGMFRMFAPKEVGGLELTPSDAFRATVAISAADPAVGWYIVNSMAPCLFAAALPEAERNALFVEPDRNFGFSAVALAKATPVDGGYKLNGMWPVVTGCNDSLWCALAGIVQEGDKPRMLENGRPDVRMFLVPTEQLDIKLTWQHAAAMRGTGSNQATAKDVFVSEVLAHSPSSTTLIDRPLFRCPASLLTLPIFAAAAVGVLQGAIESACEEIKAKVSTRTGKTFRDQTETQLALANASAALRGIRAGSLEAFDKVWEKLKNGEAIPNALKAEMYSSAFYAGDVAREMVSLLYTKGSSAAFMEGHALERCLANIHAVVSAIDARRSFHHSAGLVMLGGDPLEAAF